MKRKPKTLPPPTREERERARQAIKAFFDPSGRMGARVWHRLSARSDPAKALSAAPRAALVVGREPMG